MLPFPFVMQWLCTMLGLLSLCTVPPSFSTPAAGASCLTIAMLCVHEVSSVLLLNICS